MSDATAGKPVEASSEPAAPSVAEAGPSPSPGGDTAKSAGGDGGLTTEVASGSGGQGARTRPRRRRGSRGGRGRSRSGNGSTPGTVQSEPDAAASALPVTPPGSVPAPASSGSAAPPRVTGERPKIGDTRPAPPPAGLTTGVRTGGNGRSRQRVNPPAEAGPNGGRTGNASGNQPAAKSAGSRAGEGSRAEGRKGGRERRGKAVGRYMICVHVRGDVTHIALLEGRTLVEHYVSRASDDSTQIDGNIYRGRVQNVLPGMEAAFIDIGTPKNAVLYHGDVRYDTDDVEPGTRGQPRIEQLLRPGQSILCQVTKNPIGAKGARLTQEVSLPGRFVVLVPNSTAFGISKRLDDGERKRLRRIVDAVRPEGHGLIVRTAAAGASAEELADDVERLVRQWETIAADALKGQGASLLYREPAIAVRVIREELNREYRAVVIDDRALYEQVKEYVGAVNPELADRVEFFDPEAEPLPMFERYHVHEQLHKALDRKVFLPSGGSLVIDRAEALTVIDVNTGKNVGTTNLEETVYRNNLEAADEVARQLRLRDIGGIIVIDFIDMEIKENRDKVGSALRSALARDKTRTQVFDISELGLVEMTRKRVSEGLIESLSTTCEICGGAASSSRTRTCRLACLCTPSSRPGESRRESPRARSSASSCSARNRAAR